MTYFDILTKSNMVYSRANQKCFENSNEHSGNVQINADTAKILQLLNQQWDAVKNELADESPHKTFSTQEINTFIDSDAREQNEVVMSKSVGVSPNLVRKVGNEYQQIAFSQAPANQRTVLLLHFRFPLKFYN